jgi:hypothetical protein
MVSSFMPPDLCIIILIKGGTKKMAQLKYAKYIVTEDFLPPLPPGFIKRMEEQRKAGNYLEATHMLTLNDSVVEGAFYFDCVWLWDKHGSEAVQTEIAHTHDFDEILGFIGSRRENPRDLNAEIEFWLEDEKYIITKSSLIFVPRGVKHLPLFFQRIDSPVLFFTGGNAPSYGRTSGNE